MIIIQSQLALLKLKFNFNNTLSSFSDCTFSDINMYYI